MLGISTHCIFHKACGFCLYIPPSCIVVGSLNRWVVISDRNYHIDIHGLARLLVLFSYSEPESSLAGFEKWVGRRVPFDLSQLCIALPLHVPERITNLWCSSFCCPELLPAPLYSIYALTGLTETRWRMTLVGYLFVRKTIG